ncbi:hypothetical protein [Paenibacillus gansuensis]|uniref:Uncharacterized protein n=1 Tax=Paenibacillus gansuensis TaxID=306542 RepID=A0ABW5P7U8_9BACL
MAMHDNNTQGNETINVQLTVKEALALTGTRFNHNHEIAVDAKKKLMKSLEKKLISN